jgi:heme-degrading monooxygenase HmoA
MYISITSSQTDEQSPKVEGFLKTFLPKMRGFPGVIAIYHYSRPEKGAETTIVIWESEEALKRYRASDLIKESIAFEKKQNLQGIREAYPLKLSL